MRLPRTAKLRCRWAARNTIQSPWTCRDYWKRSAAAWLTRRLAQTRPLKTLSYRVLLRGNRRLDIRQQGAQHFQVDRFRQIAGNLQAERRGETACGFAQPFIVAAD